MDWNAVAELATQYEAAGLGSTRQGSFLKDMAGWLAEGKLAVEETAFDGVGRWPEAMRSDSTCTMVGSMVSACTRAPGRAQAAVWRSWMPLKSITRRRPSARRAWMSASVSPPRWSDRNTKPRRIGTRG